MNDSPALEREAEVMGAAALRVAGGPMAAAIQSVSGVRVAVNYTIVGAAPGTVRAYNGQMFPVSAAAPLPRPGVIRPGHPVPVNNGANIPVPYQFLGYFGI